VNYALAGLLLAAGPGRPHEDADDDSKAPDASEGADGSSRLISILAVVLRGNERTRDATLLELLPRPAPATFSENELLELERRINNLGIFDSVDVRVVGSELVVTVREKFTITPSLDFSTGQTLADFEVSAGATEYNFLGRASELGLVAGWEQRGPLAWLWYSEHALRARRWAFAAAAGFERASLRFGPDPDAPDAAWARGRAQAEMAWRTPYSYRLPVRYEVGGFFLRELIEHDVGPVMPPDGYAFGTSIAFTLDRYTWRDLVPSGVRVRLQARPGWFVPDPKARFAASAMVLAAAPLGKLTVFATRTQWDFVSSGNANHSALVGSQDGVRGLPDAFYRTRHQAYVNVELRHAIKLAERWALQGVIFSDGAIFEPMDARGSPTSWKAALSSGVGIRVIPTFLTQLLARVDGARLFVPEGSWFFQLGVTQYF
jgi:surface antigen-like variable number repeat protein